MRDDGTHKPAPAATGVLLAGLLGTSTLVSRAVPSEMAHTAALVCGASLALSFLVDMKRDPRRLVRADVMALCALYFLTLFEFLFPQPIFDTLVVAEEVGPAIDACLVGFAGLAIGRHMAPPAPYMLTKALRSEFPPRLLLTLFGIAIFGGYFYQLVSVDFNVIDWLNNMMAPRFTQMWSRGRLGDWKALLGEFGMIINLAPPIGGIILARRRYYSRNAVIVVAFFVAFTFFYGFTSGTRNVLVTYVATFTVAYAFTLEAGRKQELIFVSALAAAAILSATVFMLRFRNIGFANYVRQTTVQLEDDPASGGDRGLFVDYNLYVIAKLINVFPDRHPYLGFEIPYLSLVRPIPRAIWSGKPEGLSMSIEDSLGVEGLTLASSFVGEAYISGGLLGVLLSGLGFGVMFGWWNRFAHPANSPFGHLVFASGFFAAVISIRSMFVFTTAMLPTVAALLIGTWLINSQPPQRATPPA
jgi:hypothetical protein